MAKKRVLRGKVLNKLDSIEHKIDKIGKEEKSIENAEKNIISQESKIELEEKQIDKALVKFAGINIKKRHLYETLRAAAGAFLGVGLGRSLLGLDSLARTLPWLNIIGILAFILILSTLLIYKTERDKVTTQGLAVVYKRLAFIYFISLVIEFLSIVLFKVQYDDIYILIKIMIVGSYAAMASAVSFSLDK